MLQEKQRSELKDKEKEATGWPLIVPGKIVIIYLTLPKTVSGDNIVFMENILSALNTKQTSYLEVIKHLRGGQLNGSSMGTDRIKEPPPECNYTEAMDKFL